MDSIKKDSAIQDPARIDAVIARKLLYSLTSEKLRHLYSFYDLTPQLSESASKAFVVNKIIEKVSVKDLLQNEDFVLEIISKFDELSSSLEHMLSSLDKDTVKQVCEELGESEIAKAEKKSEIIRRLVAEVPFQRIWNSKSLKQKFRPKKTQSTGLGKIKTEINAMSEMIKELDQKRTELSSESFQEIAEKVQRILTELEKIQESSRKQERTDSKTFLQELYDHVLRIEGPLSAETIDDVGRELQIKLNADKRTFTLKGLELMMLHYLMSQIKSLKWLPSFETFMGVVHQEFGKIKVIGEQAEIPTLRENVCMKMGINGQVFDELLIQAWEKGLVKLDVGAPIGRSDVKYLKTKGGNLFFYVKLIR